jgi:hypothetical protein
LPAGPESHERRGAALRFYVVTDLHLPGARADLLPGAARLAELHAAEVPQKDDLCGAFCAALALRAAGVLNASGEEVAQDDVALLAGTTLFEGAHAASLPPGEPGRRDYVVGVPRTDDEPVSGTSATGLARAIEELAGDRLRVVPAAGGWSADALAAVLAAATAVGGDCAVLANIGTRFFWGSRPCLAALLRYLEDGDADGGPAPDWDVGHFVLLLGVVEGRRGRLVVVADTYRSLGREGVHLQPLERVALALRRPGMTEGGLLLVVAADQADALESEIAAAGLAPRLWDNGSVDVRARA